MTNGACGIDAHCRTAFRPRAAAQAHSHIRTARDFQRPLAIVEGGKDARHSKQGWTGRVVGMKSDGDSRFLRDRHDLLDEVCIVRPDLVRTVLPSEYQ